MTLFVAGCAAASTDQTAVASVPPTTAATTRPQPDTGVGGTSFKGVVYRLDDELWVDKAPLGISTPGPPRWRPKHPDQVAYISHSDPSRAGIFLFEQTYLRNLTTGTDELLLDVADHGWTEAGHIDWNVDGTRLVFAALESGRFVPHVLDVESGQVTRIDSDAQVIDTVFAPDDRILGIDTTGADEQLERVAWVGSDGGVQPLASSTGVNRDPVVSPDGRHVANIRASGPLARVFIGRWDLVITDLQTGTEWIIGDGQDGFGPPRWIDDRSVIAKHGRYSEQGIIASIPDVVSVNILAGTIEVQTDIPPGAWDPDPPPPGD